MDEWCSNQFCLVSWDYMLMLKVFLTVLPGNWGTIKKGPHQTDLLKSKVLSGQGPNVAAATVGLVFSCRSSICRLNYSYLYTFTNKYHFIPLIPIDTSYLQITILNMHQYLSNTHHGTCQDVPWWMPMCFSHIMINFFHLITFKFSLLFPILC